MTWSSIYHGDGTIRDVTLPDAPPWRRFPPPVIGGDGTAIFQPPEGLTEAVTAALSLRRPLLLTGSPGSGKSTVIDSVALELQLGDVLHWHITSRSTLSEALYRYDALGRIHAHQLAHNHSSAPTPDDIGPYLQLGPLGTALIPSSRPRALIIDEIDKSDLDLPSDLLDVLERGEFEIPELARFEHDVVAVRAWGGDDRHEIHKGRVRCAEFPFIIMTSNGERDFPAPFLRRCIRFTMPEPSIDSLTRIVTAHLGAAAADTPMAVELIDTFIKRVKAGESLAVDQLLNTVFLLTDGPVTDAAQRKRLTDVLMRELTHG
jgi:MoxR-like ATPase